MNLEKKNLRYIFIVTILITLFIPVFIPSFISTIRIHTYIPFLIVIFYQRPLISSLWWALFFGLFLDLLSPHHHLGIFAINLCFTSLLIYPQKRNFFADNLSTLPIMTVLFSIISTIVHFILLRVFEQKVPLSTAWVIGDLIIMPLLDGVFAFFIFIVPSIFFRKKVVQD